MFQDQLESVKHEQYTITPENLIKLKDRLQHYYNWVKTEMPTPNSSPMVPAPITNLGPVSGAIAVGNPNLTPGALSIVGAGTGLPNGINNAINPNLMATSNPATNVNPTQSAALTNNPGPVVGAPTPPVPGTAGIVVKKVLTPADLKLPPPKKSTGSPPIASFAVSNGLDAGMALQRPNSAVQQETLKNAQATLSVASSTPQGGTSPTPAVAKVLDASNLTSSQLLMAQRSRQLLQQSQLQQQQAAQSLPLHLQETHQTTAQPPQQVQIQASPHQQQLLSSAGLAIGSGTTPGNLAIGSGIIPGNLAKPLESLSREDLIQQIKTFQQTPASKQSPAMKLHIQKVQGELAKQHRQEQVPRLVPNTVPLPQQLLPPRHPAVMPAELPAQDPKAISHSDPHEFLTLTYKNLVRVADSGNVNDEVVTHESAFMLHNTFEGFVGKRIGNGMGKDVYDEGPLKRSRRELRDDAVMNRLLCNAEGHSDPYMASYVDWAQEVQASK